MARKYTPVALDLKPVLDTHLGEAATCPQCGSHITQVLGRMGLRLVFRCDKCLVRFFRQRPASASASFL